MKNTFIIVRYDRMKMINLSNLYSSILNHCETLDLDSLGLKDAFERLKNNSVLLNNLNTKQRKHYETPEIAALWKRSDEIVSALLLQLKSILRADFVEQYNDSVIVCNYLRKHFDRYVHASYTIKNKRLKSFKFILENDKEFCKSFNALSLDLYFTYLSDIISKIEKLDKSRSKTKNSQPRGKDTLPAKEKLIEELRLFLKIIDVQQITQRDKDYSILVKTINVLLIEERAQLRNLATRRKNAKNKALLKEKEDKATAVD